MARVAPIQNSLVGGEISPRLYGRSDTEKYHAAAKAVANAIVAPHGGAYSRPGFSFVHETKDSTKFSRLIDFEFSDQHAYAIEMGEGYFRFYRDGGIIVDGSSVIVEVANTYLEADLRDIQYAQTADLIYLVHPDYPVKVLSRFSHISWTFTDVAFVDGPYNPRNYDGTFILTTTGTYTVGGTCTITATGTGFTPFTAANVGEPIRLQDEADTSKFFWAEIVGFTSSTIVTATVKVAVPTELQAKPSYKWNMDAFTAANGYPATVGLSGQRVWFGATTAKPQTFWGSVLADLNTFSLGTDADLSIVFTLAAKKPHKIQWIAGLGRGLMVGTRGGEWNIHGGGSPITPTNIQADPETSRGSDRIQPIEAGYALLMVQKFGHKLRELKTDFETSGYIAPDLTIMAEHLARTSKIVDIAYQAERESVVWAILDDGSLIGMTYEPEQKVVAWHHHDTQGTFEAITSIPGTDADDVYVVVNRTINGTTKRFVELMMPTVFDGIHNAFYVDSGLTYTGPVYTVTAISVANPCVVRIDIGSEAYSFTGDGDQSLQFSDVEGMTEVNGDTYTIQSSSLVGGTVYDVTLNLDSTEYTAYTSGGAAQYGIKTVTGMTHLEGMEVVILADGGVEDTQDVSSGSVTLSEPAAVVHVGLSYTPKIEFLEPDSGAQNGTSMGKIKRYNNIKVLLSESAGCKINDQEIPFRRINDEMGKPVELFSGIKSVENLGWDREALVTIEQPQPLPMNVLMMTGTLTTSDS